MPDDDKMKISALPSALTLDNTDEMVLNQGAEGSKTTKKGTISVIATHFLEIFQINTLQTRAKTIVGAINELFNGGGGGGSSTLSGLTDVNISSPSNGQVLKYNSTSSKWVNAAESGGSSYTDVTGTLIAGNTSLTIQDAAITSSSKLDFYTDVFGVDPTDAVASNGQVVLTFEARSSDLGVCVRVW